MANEVLFQPEQIQQEGRRVADETASNFQENNNALFNALNDMVQKSFISSGARTKLAEFESYKPVLEEMHKIMIDYGTYLQKTSTMIRDNEDLISSEFKVNSQL